MARTQKINREEIYSIAIQIADKKGLEQLTIQKIAQKLNVKPPSLYGHIKSLLVLKKHIATHANLEMSATLREAVKNKTKDKAILALALAYREFALNHKGLYQLSVIFPVKGSQAWMNSHLEMRELFANVLRENYQLNEKETRTLARTLRSLLHGYISFEISNGWSNIVEMDQSFQTSIEHFILSVESINTSNKSSRLRA